jgi:hypothetical protein
MYFIQHCFTYRPSDSSESEDAEIEPRNVATLALTARRSNHSFVTINTLQKSAKQNISLRRIYRYIRMKLRYKQDRTQIFLMIYYDLERSTTAQLLYRGGTDEKGGGCWRTLIGRGGGTAPLQSAGLRSSIWRRRKTTTSWIQLVVVTQSLISLFLAFFSMLLSLQTLSKILFMKKNQNCSYVRHSSTISLYRYCKEIVLCDVFTSLVCL